MAAAGRWIKADRDQERDHRTLRAQGRLIEGHDRIGRGKRSRDIWEISIPSARSRRLRQNREVWNTRITSISPRTAATITAA